MELSLDKKGLGLESNYNICLDDVSYNIELVSKLDKELDGNRGIILYEELKILLDKDLPPELLILTAYHELAHAICERTSFNSMLEEKLGENGYEIFIDNLGRIIYNLFSNNDINLFNTLLKTYKIRQKGE